MIELRLLGPPEVIGGDGIDVAAVLVQPKRLALLAYLAVAAPRGFHRRDRLVATFWPDLDQEHARTALRKSVHALRAELGEETIVGRTTEELAVNEALLTSDVRLFERAADEGRYEEALDRYRGDFLDGVFVSDALEFERWVERERARLRDRAALAAWGLAEARERSGDAAGAIALARRAVELSPDDEPAIRRLIALYDRTGDRAGAARTYDAFARRLAEDHDVAPTAETAALMDAVRRRTEGSGAAAPPLPAPAAPRATRSRQRGVAVAVVAVTLLAGILGTRQFLISAPPGVSTASPVALRAYQEGLARYGHGDYAEAFRSFQDALLADSGFALAAYYAALSCEEQFDDSGYTRYHDLARRLAPRATTRERLLILATWADRAGDKDALTLAESLAALQPAEAEGHYFLGRALLATGDCVGDITQIRGAVGRYSASFDAGAKAPCIACSAQRDIGFAYQLADSFPAAERAAREWVRVQPGSGEAWHQLAVVLLLEDRGDEALAAQRRADGLRANNEEDAMLPVSVAMRAARFDQVDRLLRALIDSGDAGLKGRGEWEYVISLRYQGRFREALAVARRYRRENTVPAFPAAAAAPEAQVLFEMGRVREAAGLFESVAVGWPASSPAVAARNRAWYLTHAATAWAAAGDRAALARLADRVEAAGRESNYGRDPLLHHYVRGLEAELAGRPAEAAAAFQRAVYSGTQGFSRNGLELGRALEASGRPADAVRVLQAALKGPQSASGMYATQTELHEALAQAFDAIAARDSAAAHYRWVLAAWTHPDPILRRRRDAARARLAALGG